MATAGDVASKLCTSCGENVSNKPRTKDARGRYFCKPCYEQAMARSRAAPPAAARSKPDMAGGGLDADESDLLSGLSGGTSTAAPTMKVCPGCRGGLASDAVLCVGCGFDFRTGKKTQKQISQATAEQRAKGRRGGSLDFASPMVIALGLFVFYGGCVAAMMTSEALIGPAAIAMLVVNLVIWIWALVEAFSGSILWGVLSLIFGIPMIYVVYIKSDNSRLKAAFTPMLLFSILSRVMLEMGGDSA